MPSYFRGTVECFLQAAPSELLAKLTLGYARDGFSEMRSDVPLTWWSDLEFLRQALELTCSKFAEARCWGIVLEFTIPRKLRRIDVVLLVGTTIVLFECKTTAIGSEARRQVEHYALLLHYFHSESSQRRILPLCVSPEEISPDQSERDLAQVRQEELFFPALPRYWIRPTQTCSWENLPTLLLQIPLTDDPKIDVTTWEEAAYKPTPTIIEAACALRGGLSIREVALSEAAEHDIARVVETIRDVITRAERGRQHAICFLTGVPGSGKTLVGLSLAHLSDQRADAIHFMSGNGPLVKVLQELFRVEGMREGQKATDALVRAQTLIENVHVFAKTYSDKDPQGAPSNHVMIFDEAQRAWDKKQNKAKFNRDYSEPEMLLRIMERHADWACVVALVGGGQEINSGEAGLEEWGKSLLAAQKPWVAYASPEVIEGGTSTAGRRLFGAIDDAVAPPVTDEAKPFRKVEVTVNPFLHLRTSNRSLRAENLASWVNLVLGGDASQAAALDVTRRFPVLLTRSLALAREVLRRESLGASRFGLVGSSKASRLRAEGLEPDSNFHAGYPWHHWYLAPREDVRSSFACEVFTTEFEVQGLELDWVGVCWGGDFIWSGREWLMRKLSYGSAPKWRTIRSADDQLYRRNAYRVLLTRARQGMVIFIPSGDTEDTTRSPAEFDRTAEFLIQCGVRLLS